MENFVAVILAGGKGSRMRSDLPKVLHKIGGKAMVLRNIEKLKSVGFEDFVVVVGYKAEEVKQVVKAEHFVTFANQEVPLGTSHALKTGLEAINPADFEHIFVINGDDAAFYAPETLQAFIESHLNSKAVLSIMTLEMEGEHELGKIIRDENGKFLNTLEKFEYENLDITSNEINCGVYIYDASWVAKNIIKVEPNGKGEYPITDLLKLAKEQNEIINLFQLSNPNEWLGVNTPEELAVANSLLMVPCYA